MRGSPFEVFRRNQRQLMVALTALAMFSFLFLDIATLRSGRTPVSLGVVLIALIFGGGMWIVGSSRGKGTEFALWGALVGAIVGFIGFSRQSEATVVQTSLGSYTRSDFQHLAQRRSLANRFLFMAAPRRQMSFGGTDDRSLLMRAILLKEAKKSGITISDDGVSEFLQDITNNQLPLSDYRRILHDLGVSESDLYEILREEIAVQLMLRMELPPASSGHATTAAATPYALWKLFLMLNRRQTIETAELPASAFVAQVSDPQEEELLRFFEMYRARQPSADGQPGFLRERRVKLAYLKADFETFEKLAGEPTAAEIEAYYENNKDLRYRAVPELEMPQPPTEKSPAADAEPTDALQPANQSEVSAPPSSTAPDNTPRIPPPPPLPMDGQAAQHSSPVDLGASSAGPWLVSALLAQTASSAATQAETNLPQPSTPSTSPLPVLELPPPSGMPPTNTPPASSPATSEPPRYRPLDEALRLEIRDTLLRERGLELMRRAADAAHEEMLKLADEYHQATEPSMAKQIAQQLAIKLQEYAQRHNLQYRETPLMTFQELSASTEEPIGSAIEPSADFRQPVTVAREVFSSETLYDPRRADTPTGQAFAYWKIEDQPPAVPDFKDVRSQVVDAWKLEKARELAQKRGQELVELARTKRTELAEAFAGQTVTGSHDAPALVVKKTPPFTWLTMPRNVPFEFFSMFTPRLSTVEGIKQPGEEFMRIVFEELAVGDVGLAPNQPRTEYYVVRVLSRDDTPSPEGDDLALKALQQQFLQEGREQFLNPAYFSLSGKSMDEVQRLWQQEFEKRYQVVWQETAVGRGRPREF